jgi:hypothetical protein
MEKEKKNEMSGLTPSQEAKVCKKIANKFKTMKAEFEKNEREKAEKQSVTVRKVIEAVNGLSVGDGITIIGAAVGLIVKNADPTNENHTTERTISKLTTIVCNTIVQLSQKKEQE